jgi:DNA invertase Pin-like site-specific DNA recombinase
LRRVTAKISNTATRAASYVRMSTNHQKYSIVNQLAAIEAYAARRDMVIVRSYADEGKSGLVINSRDGLKKLIDDVEGRQADFDMILVYDVSRWGRFQDVDESAHYEFVCRRAGIQVHYCTEPFENDGSPLSAVVKSLKRAMAGEYSRELSVKTFAGQCRIARLGFKIGGNPGYGYRRLLVDQNGVAKGILKPREQKSVATDRVTLVPGPAEEVATVRWIFTSFARDRKTEGEIANALNRRGIVNSQGKPWDRNGVSQLLKNERYIGNCVWNQTSKKLKSKQVRNSAEVWFRAEGAFQALVERPLFDAAQSIYEERKQRAVDGHYRKYSDEELLQRLRGLLAKHGYVSRALLAQNSLPCAHTFDHRFGGLKSALRKIGYAPPPGRRRSAFTRAGRPNNLSDEEMLQRLRSLWQRQGYLTQKAIDRDKTLPATKLYQKRFGSLARAYEIIGFVPDPKSDRQLLPLSRRRWSDEALFDHLRSALKQRGRLSRAVLNEAKAGPSRGTIERRFGGLMRAFELIGYVGGARARSCRPRNLTDEQMLLALCQLWRKRGHLSQMVIAQNKEVPSVSAFVGRFGSLTKAYELIGFEVDWHRYQK